MRAVGLIVVCALTWLTVLPPDSCRGDDVEQPPVTSGAEVDAESQTPPPEEAAAEAPVAADSAPPPPASKDVVASAETLPSGSPPPPTGRGMFVDDDLEELPWDYTPYRVLVWLVSDDPTVNTATIEKPLRLYLDRDFSSVWRMHVADAPTAVRTAAMRDLGKLSYDSITAADPVLAIKRDHREAVRIRIPKNVAQYVNKVYGTKGRIDEVKRRAAVLGDETVDGVAERFEAIDGDAVALRELWSSDETEGVLVSRGMAMTLIEPEAKLITPSITDLVAKAVESYDKIFIVRVRRETIPHEVAVVELDCLMRHFGPVARVETSTLGSLTNTVGRGITTAFAPVVRIENAGQRNAVGLLRAGGLILDENSPAAIGVDDVLQPMTRKNDRNGKPILIGPIDWAFLLVTELEGRNIKMDYYAGRAGGLQGRKNKRTFRTALRVRPFGESTLLRLHLQREPDFPLIGYELYEKELKSTKMTFIGRTDWNGRLQIEPSEKPFRLLYVKNGGAVLARLPLVPGLRPMEVADLSGDDMRLQAEAYIRGVQNAIIDLVALRELFKARIRLRLERGEMEKAEVLMNALRDQPSNEALANEMGKKQTMFIKALGSKNANQRRKVDEMFTTTRELLSKHINPQMVRELEDDLIAAKKNGGRLPPKEDDSDEESDDSTPPAAQPAADAAAANN